LWLNVGYLEVPEKGLCVPIPYLLWDKSPFYLLQEIVWKYGAGVSTKNRLSPRNEKWLFYLKNCQEYTFNLDNIRDPNVKYPNQKKNGKYRCIPSVKILLMCGKFLKSLQEKSAVLRKEPDILHNFL